MNGLSNENVVNHMLWRLWSPDLNQIEHLRGILDAAVGQHSPPPSSKHQIRKYPLKERNSSLQLSPAAPKLHWQLVVAQHLN